ncbi:probable glutathione S-transferase [Vigna umbellata]|uniref:probable glutathione S-transferase n=1 Tax=Vigna umbellata TaxID=87088 RepID=UPI001F5F16E9|nr:probable glutathione S-transferase [Vigna umbellata]XP_047181384.1 probable glutathione S-transferase [Vigna umbellata]
MGDEVILLNFWLSPYGMRVQIALEEKGIKYEKREEDLSNKSSLLLQMNPVHKKIPVLIHNSKPICESLIAVEYIDEVWNEQSPLLPSNPYQRAQARFWANYVDTLVYKHATRFWTTEGEEREAAGQEFLESLKLLEEQLGDEPHFGGNNFGFVDVALVPLFCYFYTFSLYGNFISEAQYPKIISWARRCIQRESVSKSFPQEQMVKEYISQKRNKG